MRLYHKSPFIELPHDKCRQILNFLENIITSPSEEFRKETLLSFEQFFGYSRALFFLIDSGLNLIDPVCINIDDYYNDIYYQYFSEKDIFYPKSIKNKMLETQVVTITELMTFKQYEMTEYYNEFLRDQDVYYESIISLYHEGRLIGLISLLRSLQEKDFSPIEIKILKKLSVFLSKLMANHLLLDYQENQKNLCNEQVQTIYNKPLTIRETEIVELVIKGLSNQEIADTLFISLYTVKIHIGSILKKLDVKNRTGIAHRVLEHKSKIKK